MEWRDGSRMGAGWEQDGSRMGAGWEQDGSRMGGVCAAGVRVRLYRSHICPRHKQRWQMQQPAMHTSAAIVTAQKRVFVTV